jgi:hypothetical protein
VREYLPGDNFGCTKNPCAARGNADKVWLNFALQIGSQAQSKT